MPKLHFLERQILFLLLVTVYAQILSVSATYTCTERVTTSCMQKHRNSYFLSFSLFFFFLDSSYLFRMRLLFCFFFFLVCLILGLIFGVCMYMNFWVICISPGSLNFLNSRLSVLTFASHLRILWHLFQK